jgi:hypothetical protein
MYLSHWKPPGVSERMWSVKLKCVNFRRVSAMRRAFLPVVRVTAISADWDRNTM